jgi:hypothetical protein
MSLNHRLKVTFTQNQVEQLPVGTTQEAVDCSECRHLFSCNKNENSSQVGVWLPLFRSGNVPLPGGGIHSTVSPVSS